MGSVALKKNTPGIMYKMKWILLYRASRDGDSPINYHNKCDRNRRIFCIIKTRKGCKFWGYTETEIQSEEDENVKEYNSFVFSLNKLKIYENVKKKIVLLVIQKIKGQFSMKLLLLQHEIQ